MPELEKISFLPVEIKDESEPSGFSLRGLFARKPTREEISGISEDLATLVKGGVTLDRALLILSETGVRPAVGNLMRDLHREISAGHSLAEAVSQHPDLFPKTFAKMVEVAEVAGTLDETLQGDRARTAERREPSAANLLGARLSCLPHRGGDRGFVLRADRDHPGIRAGARRVPEPRSSSRSSSSSRARFALTPTPSSSSGSRFSRLSSSLCAAAP